MIKAIIFDFFGVICDDQYEAWLGHRKQPRQGVYQALSHRADHGDITMEQFFSDLAEYSGLELSAIRHDFEKNTRINLELVAIITKLKAHYQLGVISNSSADWINSILDNFQLTSLFDEVVVSAEVKLVKPDPRIFQLAIDKMGIKAEETVFIDDSSINTAAAEKLGMKAVVYNGMSGMMNSLGKLGVKI